MRKLDILIVSIAIELALTHGFSLPDGRLRLKGATNATLDEMSMRKQHDPIEYYVFTYLNPFAGELIRPDVESIIRSTFDPQLPTTFFIPRRNDFYNCPENAHIVPGKLSIGEANVIVVDYSAATNGEYADAVAASPAVGLHIADFIIMLHRHFDVPLSALHVVGFDLGAQIAGFVGQHVQQQLGERVPRITGLDPAGELFELPNVSDEERLSAGDADFVEVIHTSASHLGIFRQSGDADYYPNGGRVQPGCAPQDYHCSHERAYLFVYELWSDDNEFVSARCGSIEHLDANSCNYVNVMMGDLKDTTPRGIFYLSTKATLPYARGAPAAFL